MAISGPTQREGYGAESGGAIAFGPGELAVEPSPDSSGTLRLENVRVARQLLGCTVASRVVELTGREFNVAEVFFRHHGQVLSRRQLAVQAWGSAPTLNSNLIDVSVRSLRRKLGPDVIRTVRGVGYRFSA